MADLSTPRNWKAQPPSHRTSHVPSTAQAKEKGSRPSFLWPSPPYASYPSPTEQTETLACQILTRRDLKLLSARLTFFVPETGVAHVQMPAARTTVAVRFDQFSALTLTTPLEPVEMPRDDPHAELLGGRRSASYRVQLVEEGDLSGTTIGHVESECGLFLFPPTGDNGAVQRTFIPRSAYTRFEIGPKLGEVLVDAHATDFGVQRSSTCQRQLTRPFGSSMRCWMAARTWPSFGPSAHVARNGERAYAPACR